MCSYFKKPLNIWLGFIPEIIFMSSLFGYLVLLIFYKWTAYNAITSKEAPSILIAFINMFLFNYNDPTTKQLYRGQVTHSRTHSHTHARETFSCCNVCHQCLPVSLAASLFQSLSHVLFALVFYSTLSFSLLFSLSFFPSLSLFFSISLFVCITLFLPLSHSLILSLSLSHIAHTLFISLSSFCHSLPPFSLSLSLFHSNFLSNSVIQSQCNFLT